ncbi:condensation domain-containing protein [Lysobacter silvisoli]|uniref:condensation domain-containing protein n=1 Tax=Lysobacter silvisoli TaxID=2293254 RepID=UPI001314CA6C|nr:condensation domain-containing protein [Lysobacter silvisoli]
MTTARPLTLYERALYGEGLLPGNVILTASLDGTLEEADLRRALAQLQARHPLLRCLIQTHDGRPWFVPQQSAPPLPLRIVARAGHDDWNAWADRELQTPIDGARFPLARVLWLRGERHHELIVVCHHAICDGRALIALLDGLLRACAYPEQTPAPRDALPAFADLVPAIVRHDPRLQRSIRWRAAALRLLLRLLPQRPTQHYGAVYRELWTLDEAATRRLSERCRQEGVSLYAALALAHIQAFREVCGRRVRRYRAPVDMRRLLPAIGDDALFGIAPTVELKPGAPFDGRARDTFWTRARALQDDLQERIEALGPRTVRNFLGLELLHPVYARMAAYGRAQRAGAELTLSNLGRLPLAQDYRGLRLRAVRGISGLVGETPAQLLTIAGYAGRLEFVLASDEDSLPRAQALRIRERATDLLQALGEAAQTHPANAAPVRAP